MSLEKISGKIIITGLYIFFLLMIFQNLIKTYFKNEYLFVGYMLGVLLLLFIFVYILAKRIEIEICDLDWLIIFFIIVQLIWMIPNFYQYPKGAIMGLMYNIRNFFMPYAIIRLSIIGFRSQERLIKWMSFLIAIVAACGIYFFYFDVGMLSSISAGGSLVGRRASSFLFTSLDTAFCSMIFGLIAFSYIIEKNKVFGWIVKVFYLFVFLFSLILTFTRSAYLGFLAGFLSIIILYLIGRRINRKIAIIVILIFLIAISIILFLLMDKTSPEFPSLVKRIIITDDSNTLAHIESNNEALKIFLKNPFGIGPGKSGWTVTKWQASEGTYIESSFLQVMVETGIVGIIVLIMIWVKILMISISNYFKSKNPLFLGLFGATLGIIVASFFLPVYYYSTAMSFYWGLVAISMFFRNKDYRHSKILR
ncbi:MAG: O-antigen ligase family protein [Actinomycetia bacterium]|nr:O-antigen ligase family protein [Actinomycetes bacterium]